MKHIIMVIILLATFLSNNISAQTTKITQLLQATLQQENKARKMIQVEIDSLGNEIGLMKQDLDSLEVTELTVKRILLFISPNTILLMKRILSRATKSRFTRH